MSIFTTRPLIMGTKAVVAAGHYLAAVAGMRILERGGNAIDSAEAIGFSLAVLEAHMNSIGGEVQITVTQLPHDEPSSLVGFRSGRDSRRPQRGESSRKRGECSGESQKLCEL